MSGPTQTPTRLPIETVRSLLEGVRAQPDRRSASTIIRIYREQFYARPDRAAPGFSVAMCALGALAVPVALRMGGVTMMGPITLLSVGGIGLGNWARTRSHTAEDRRELRELGDLARRSLEEISRADLTGHFGLREEAEEVLRRLVKEDPSFKPTAEAILASRTE